MGTQFAGSGDGAAYLYAESAGAWPTTPTASFTGTGDEGLGYSVALSADGQAALVGAPFASAVNGGRLRLRRVGRCLAHHPGGEFHRQRGREPGSSVALSADGQVALVGGPAPSSAAARPTSTPSRPAAGTPARWPPSGAARARASALRWRCRPTAGPPWWALTPPGPAERRSFTPRQADVPVQRPSFNDLCRALCTQSRSVLVLARSRGSPWRTASKQRCYQEKSRLRSLAHRCSRQCSTPSRFAPGARSSSTIARPTSMG